MISEPFFSIGLIGLFLLAFIGISAIVNWKELPWRIRALGLFCIAFYFVFGSIFLDGVIFEPY